MVEKSSAEAQKAVWRTYEVLAKDISELLPAKAKDVPRALSPMDRRALVRSVGSLFEAVAYVLKTSAVSDPRDVLLTTAEIALAQEVTYCLDSKGRPKEGVAKLRVEENVRFAFALFAKTTHHDFTLDVGGDGWEYFRYAVTLRNKLMHPKTIDALDISDESTIVVVRAFMWFQLQIHDLLMASTAALKKRQRILGYMARIAEAKKKAADPESVK